MSVKRCAREDELLDALARGFTGAELDAHAVECVSCRELRLVAGALLDERAEALHEAPIPSAAAMWWRMQMRRRHEVQVAARRSLVIGQAATLGVAVAILIALFGGDVAVELRQVAASIRISTPILLAVATWLVAAPIAGWVAIRGK